MADMNETVRRSRFWLPLWQRYGEAPSIALCRVPELEYAARLTRKGRLLDHCCGDGTFASLAWPGRSAVVGCDIDAQALGAAARRGLYLCVVRSDVSRGLPFESGSFDIVFNNSGLEHVRALDSVLEEVARVLRPGGEFALNVLNHRYFEWWPVGDAARDAYRQWQPFFHALPLSGWSQRLKSAGFEIARVEGYFDRRAARMLAELDCAFSGFFLAGQRGALVSWYQRMPRVMGALWRRRLESLRWRTEPDAGAGFFIEARRLGP